VFLFPSPPLFARLTHTIFENKIHSEEIKTKTNSSTTKRSQLQLFEKKKKIWLFF